MTKQQPPREPITFYISFNQRHRLAKEGLDNLMGVTWGVNLDRLHHEPVFYPLFYGPLVTPRQETPLRKFNYENITKETSKR